MTTPSPADSANTEGGQHPEGGYLSGLAARFEATQVSGYGEQTLVVDRTEAYSLLRALRDDPNTRYEQLIDLCGVDYGDDAGLSDARPERFAVVYHLLSISRNRRLRVVAYLPDDNPLIASVVTIWACANWFEREAFDLFGILFEGHPDLRRLLTDYGFIGHPMRKDFPLSGHVEMRFDEEKGRVVYEPVSIDPRVTVPRVIRHESLE
ncbi:MAG: NADH-quinone oxidoreductase subunit C [Arenicellales bacterium]|nr:NADH-quinone oxidoreductase subunit C [Arenicellales bacterium]MDP6551517.1 NADH-quinone oxidoreductase subunit C [Arenicellales bacterium]MDP6790969.1 NADH-quinone oxidoreductase subunit C [Arenicellales bacterium]MDP6918515.1 NADH-quinone oxidoreductase subunit C [Arenicellales bacterium]